MCVLISVVVCTHNRVELLVNILQTLCEQSLDQSEYEVIVVDNNSTDRTRSVVENFSRRYPNIRYYLETKIGLSHARNRGWQEAQGLYVAYTDDDCKLPPQWLNVANDIIMGKSPAVFGGPFLPFYNTVKPSWFKDTYGSYTPYHEPRILMDKEYLVGGNIFFRRELLAALGGFDANLGMNGKRIAYGEETALQMGIRESMPDQIIFYDPSLYLYHLVRAEKMKLHWLIRAFFAKSEYVYLTSHSNDSPIFGRMGLLLRAVKIMLELLIDLSCGVLRRDRTQYPYFQNYLYEHTSKYLRGWGKLYAQYLHVGRAAK